MIYVLLYWGVMLAGYFFGYRMRGRISDNKIVDKVMLVCVSTLVFIMGLRMGSNEEVISQIGNIGIEALIITIILWIGGILAVFVTRKLLGYDKQGRLHGMTTVKESEDLEKLEQDEEAQGNNLMTWLIIIFVIIGILAGYFIVQRYINDIDSFSTVTGNMMTIGLCIMLAFIGYDMGLSGTVVQQLKSAGLRVLAFPVAILAGTAVAAIVIAIILPITVRESLAIGFGYGWYTFAPVAISNSGHVIAGAISFMHNVFRELGGIILIPLLAGKVGYLEVTSLPGVAAMDICMPIIERTTRQDIIVYSFTIGIFESLMVPLLVPLAIGA